MPFALKSELFLPYKSKDLVLLYFYLAQLFLFPHLCLEVIDMIYIAHCLFDVTSFYFSEMASEYHAEDTGAIWSLDLM